MALNSQRFAANARLLAASNNNPPLRKGEQGEAVKILQKALIDLGNPMPISTAHGGPDGIYGSETAAVVALFQGRNGLLADGVAGRQTLGLLDQLFGIRPTPLPTRERSAAPALAIFPTQAGTTDQQVINDAVAASRATLTAAIASLASLELAILNNLLAATTIFHQRTLDALERWMKIKPSDGNFLSTVQQVRGLMTRNLGTVSTVTRRPQSDPDCNNNPFAVANPGRPDLGVRCCNAFFNCKNAGCRRDVITHEFFHLIGVNPTHATDKPRASQTTQDALNHADTLSQLVADITLGITDSCLSC